MGKSLQNGESEARRALLASIIESSHDAIMSGDLNGNFTSWNPAAEQIYGFSAQEMIGQNVLRLVPPEKEQQLNEVRKKIFDGNRIEHFESIRLRKDGSKFPISLTVSPIRDSNGTVIGTSTIARDLTDRDKAEQKFRDILDSSPDAMILVDKDGNIALVNSQTEKIFGYSRDEMLGQPVELLVPKRFQPNLYDYRDNFLASPQVQPMGEGLELFGRRNDGLEIPVEVRLSPIDTADGVVVVATIHDVTEHRQLVRRLEELNELRNEFVAVVTHDLRSPMTSISGYANLLIDAWDTTSDDKKIEYLQIIARNTEHLAQFVEDALQVARIEMGEYAFEIVEFDIRSLVQRALDEARGVNVNRRFEFTALGDIPLVLGDADRHWQVLTNLLANAVKFSPANEPITVELSCDDEFVQVSITDQGIGIANDDLAKLFQKFGRVSQSTDEKVPGNGLGLYICKNLVEAQGGRIWCESSPGRGSTFVFTIPIAR